MESPDGDRRPGAARRAALAALVCLAGVFVYAQLATGKYPISQWLFWRLLPLWALGALFVASNVSAGLFVLGRLLKIRELPFLETLVMAMGVGLAMFTVAMFAAGAVGWYQPWFALALPLGLLLLGASEFRATAARVREWWAGRPPGANLLTAAIVAWGTFNLCMLYLQAMTPDAINYDAGWYHMPVAEDYVRNGRLVPFYADYNRTFPQLPSMLHTWAMLVPGLIKPLGWMLALQTEFIIVLWKIAGVVALAEWMLRGERVRGLWAAFFLFPSIFVNPQHIGGSADHFMGFWAIPMALATARLLPAFDPRFAVLLGILTGGAALTKLQAAYMATACGVMCLGRFGYAASQLARGRPSPISARRLWQAPLLVAGAAVFVASPHFIKNAFFYGNPLYPFKQNWFASSHPVHEQSVFLFEKAYPNYPHLPKGTRIEKLLNSVRLFFMFSFETHGSLTKDYPSIGSLFTLLTPTVVLLRDTARIWFSIGVAFFAILVWANTYFHERYLQAILPIVTAVTAVLIVRLWRMGTLARMGLVPLLAFQVVFGADVMFYGGAGRLRSAVDMARSGYEGKRTDDKRFAHRSTQRKVGAALPPDARVLSRNYRVNLGIDRELLSDVQAWQAHIYYAPLRGPRELYDLYASRGITHLLFPKNDRHSGTLQADVLFAELVHRNVKKPKKFGGLVLAEMPAKPPAPEVDAYRVAVIGMSDYANGLYDVEQLHLYDRLPRELRGRETPHMALDVDEEDAAVELFKFADAVVHAARASITPTERTVLEQQFVVGEKFKSHVVWVRKDRRKRAPLVEGAAAPAARPAAPAARPAAPRPAAPRPAAPAAQPAPED